MIAPAFLRGTITVSNGDTVATISGATSELLDRGSALFIRAGGALVAGAEALEGANPNQVEFPEPWSQGDFVDAEFFAFNTIEGLIRLLREINELGSALSEQIDIIESVMNSMSTFTREQLLPQANANGWRNALGVLPAGTGTTQARNNQQNDGRFVGLENNQIITGTKTIDNRSIVLRNTYINGSAARGLSLDVGGEEEDPYRIGQLGTLISSQGFVRAYLAFGEYPWDDNNANTGFYFHPEDKRIRARGDLVADDFAQLSDETVKTQAKDVPDELLDAWEHVRQYAFKWVEAVEEKGDDARWHVSYMAQEVERVLNDNGVNSDEWGIVCKEPVYEEQETGEFEEIEEPEYETVTEKYTEIEIIDGQPVQVEKERTIQVECCDYLPVKCETGQPVLGDDDEPILYPVPRMKKVQVPVTEQIVVGHEYRLRYNLCFAIETAYLRREIERLKASTRNSIS